MGDNLSKIWSKFRHDRSANLFNRFPGWYRAYVVETNDPLSIHRIRVKIPELHDFDLAPNRCPWAVSATGFGGKGSGDWVSVSIGDLVWVTFEKQHAYAPIWIGGADPTRRKFYPGQSVYVDTPLSVNDLGEPADNPDDFLPEYLPKDSRPMSQGKRDRYGSFWMMNSTGYFPSEHDIRPAPPGTDGVSKSEFEIGQDKPVANDPDLKYMVSHTKYGHTVLQSDSGYNWKEEFSGDFNQDFQFEADRTKYLTKLFAEGQPTGKDQRRLELRTRYGNKIEMRDVGWNKSREGEFGDAVDIGSGGDERWIKIRSKAGMLIEMLDTGSDPEQDLFVKRLLQTEVGDSTENESSMGPDRRMIRFLTRYGFLFAMDDRGSDPKSADQNETPRGNGIMMKGRRDGRGFFIEFNEKDSMNRLMMGSPKGKGIEINDKLEYVMLHTDSSTPISEKIDHTRVGGSGVSVLSDVPFATENALTKNVEGNTNHMKLDKENKYIRFKTAEGQGVEFRDTGAPCGTWGEMRDNEGRGTFMSKKDQRLVIRDKAPSGGSGGSTTTTGGFNIIPTQSGGSTIVPQQETQVEFRGGSSIPGGGDAPGGGEGDGGGDGFEDNGELPLPEDCPPVERGDRKIIVFDDNEDFILIKNEKSGKIIQIFSKGDVQIISKRNICVSADQNIYMDAGREIIMQAGGGTQFVVKNGHVGTNKEIRGERLNVERMFGKHEVIKLPAHPTVFAPEGDKTSGSMKVPEEIVIERLEPDPFDCEQGCAPNKINAGPIPMEIRMGGGGGGGGGGGSPAGSPPTPVGSTPPAVPFVPNPETPPDKFEQVSGGVLWYGTSTKFLVESRENGLSIDSFINNENVPPNTNADKIILATSLEIARGNGGQVLKPGKDFAALAKKRYGEESLIFRVLSVPEPELIEVVEDNPDIVEYKGDNIPTFMLEEFEVGTDTFEGTPQFPNV